ncbi:MAG: YqgE/AlgH family protein [Candidatus Binatia bacterium]
MILSVELASISIAVEDLPLFAAEEERFLAGQLLVAAPEMRDSRFAHAVLYMIKHDEHGAVGLIVNRPMAKGPISDLLKSLGKETEDAAGEIILHYGGPVEGGKGFVLHSDDYALDSTTKIKDGIAVTTDVEFLRDMGLGKGPRRSLVALGYAGWAPGQLEAEIKADGWFSIPGDPELIFGADAEKKWERAMDRRKIKL